MKTPSTTEQMLDSMFERDINKYGNNWSVPTWIINDLSPEGFEMYIVDSDEDESIWQLVDRDFGDTRPDDENNGMQVLFSSSNINEVLTYLNGLRIGRLSNIYKDVVGYNILSDDPGITVDNLLRMMKEYDEAAGGITKPFKNAGVKY